MKARLVEALELLEEMMDDARPPAGLSRLPALLNGLLADCWDEDDVAVLATPADDDGVDLAEVERAVQGTPTAPQVRLDDVDGRLQAVFLSRKRTSRV